MDQLLISLQEVSVILLPTLGVVALICLSVFLVHLTKVIKRLNGTLDQVDGILKQTDGLIEEVDVHVKQLQGPLETLNNVSKSVDAVNDSAISAVSSIVKQTAQYSEGIVDWFAGKKEKKHMQETEVKEEEDFGIYE